MNDPHTLLMRQIKRCFGVDSIPALQTMLDALRDNPPAQADFDARFQRLVEMVSSSYVQFDRDLELRSRSLELSSQELTQANERLREEADNQKLVLDTLRASAGDLMRGLQQGAAAPGEDDLLGLATLLRELLLQREQAHRELQLAKNAAEAASLAKSRFLANMSHELRTPLNAVIGAAQLLQGGDTDPDSQTHLVQSIQRSGMNLLGLIENILDLSRIEAGELQLSPQDFHLFDAVDAALATAAVTARAKGLTLSCVVQAGLQPWRHGDAQRVRQVLLNLLGNAIKFTPRGDIVVTLATGAGPDLVRISITDTGIGISPAELPHIFEPFRQADEGMNRRYGGSGLGLSIVRQILVAMGGQISVQSELGQGSSFHIELPLPPAHQVPRSPPPLALPVAFYEPHEPSARALNSQLQRLGCKPQRVADGAALRQFLTMHRGPGEPPWVLLACDDAGATQCLSDAADVLDPEHLVGMTGAESGEGSLIRTTLKLPRNIMKPVLRSALVSRLARHHPQASVPPVMLPAEPVPEQSAAPKPGTTERKAVQVLVVEDDPLNQTIVCRLLSHAGYACTAASDGTQALEMLGRRAFDLVLMDWQMPDMDGLEVTRRVRAGVAGPLAQSLPIVALTANAFAEDRTACLAAGMNDFLTKPVLSDALLAAVQRWTHRGGTHDEAHTTMPLKRNSVLAVYDPTVLATLPMVADGSDPGYVDELLGYFDQSAEVALAEAEAALTQGDTETLLRLVHTLKSGAAQVGGMALAAEAARQEAVLRRHEPPETDGPARLRRSLEAFRQAVVKGRGATAGA